MPTDQILANAPWFRSTAVLATAAVAGAAFVGYAIYFDHKRRSDPLYKQKIRENRRRKTQPSQGTTPATDFPNPNDTHAMQLFFLQEVQLGEELLAEGNLEEGAEHLCNAVVACAQPEQLLTILGQTLPIEHFELIIRKLPDVKLRVAQKMQASLGGEPMADGDLGSLQLNGHAPALVDEDDLE